MLTAIQGRSRSIGFLLMWLPALPILGSLVACSDGGGGAVASSVPPPVQHYAYVANTVDNALSIYKVSAGTGKLEQLTTSGTMSVLPSISPTLVAVDPSNRFAYVANSGSHDVSAYSINMSTGALTFIGSAPAGLNPISVAVAPSGRFLYVANQNGGVSAFRINATTGALTSVGPDVAAGGEPFSVIVDPTGRFVYVTSGHPANITNDVHAFSIDATTGALTPIPVNPVVPAPAIPVHITLHPSGKFAFVASGISSSVSAYTISNTTGALTPVGTLPTGGTGPRAVAVEASGRFAYVVNVGSNDVSIFSIDATTGALTPIPVNPVVPAPGTDARFIAVDPTGRFVYVTYFNSPHISTFSMNSVTGELTHLGTEPTGAGSVGITVTNAL